ncbi:MAG: triose-phosphate isomerase [Luminiphilus sp.]|nr:triose-phosphate isomerase [Luminiphilus sp.]
MNKRYVIGNWKMHGSRSRVAAFSQQLRIASGTDVMVAIAPPYPYLGACADLPTGCGLAGQDCSAHDSGAHTGEVSASMLLEWGCQWVIVGHSERRTDLAESDQLIVAKLSAAIRAGLTPVLCVGESLAMRESGREEVTVRAQLQAALSEIPPTSLLVAYEPIWAIGTGVTASPEQADAMHAVIRNELTGLMDDGAAVPLLYGGSVNPDNAGALFDCPHVDGALVGGASLDGASFSKIVEAAQASLRQ